MAPRGINNEWRNNNICELLVQGLYHHNYDYNHKQNYLDFGLASTTKVSIVAFCPYFANSEEKSLRHVAMIAKFLDDNKPIKSLKSMFALF